MTRTGWHPRGEATWPEWRKAEPGVTRVEHVRSGRRGTFMRWPKVQRKDSSPGYAVIEWDDANGSRFATNIGRVVAFAFDLRVVREDT